MTSRVAKPGSVSSTTAVSTTAVSTAAVSTTAVSTAAVSTGLNQFLISLILIIIYCFLFK